jgi:hypothetical protein
MGHGFVRVLSVVGIGSMLAISTPLVSAATIKECKEAYAAHKDEAKAARGRKARLSRRRAKSGAGQGQDWQGVRGRLFHQQGRCD